MHTLHITPQILAQFAEKLDFRLSHFYEQLNLITEDCVRYEFYAVLLPHYNSHEIVLEHPHDSLPKKEIDLVIMKDNPLAVLEFKYYRAIPSGQEDRTARMANLYVDLMKLKLSNLASDKYFVFLTDEVMYGYLLRNGYEYMINRASFEFRVSNIHKKGLNFGKVVYQKLSDKHDITTSTMMECIYSQRLSLGHHLIVYRIL